MRTEPITRRQLIDSPRYNTPKRATSGTPAVMIILTLVAWMQDRALFREKAAQQSKKRQQPWRRPGRQHYLGAAQPPETPAWAAARYRQAGPSGKGRKTGYNIVRRKGASVTYFHLEGTWSSFYAYFKEQIEECNFFKTPFMPQLDCAQIVPVKVKYSQTVPNETKS